MSVAHLTPLAPMMVTGHQHMQSTLVSPGMQVSQLASMASPMFAQGSYPGEMVSGTMPMISHQPAPRAAACGVKRLAGSRHRDTDPCRQPRATSNAVIRRNERERNRVKQVNQGFERLREHVPEVAKSKKLSKVDTLKAAVDYINQLKGLLYDAEAVNTVLSLAEDATSTSSMPSSPDSDTTGVTPPHCSTPPHPHSLPSPASPVDSLTSPTSGYHSDVSPSYTHAPFSPEDRQLLDIATWFADSENYFSC